MNGKFNFGVQKAYKQLGEIQDKLIGRRINSQSEMHTPSKPKT
jgi:hypothetical protein